MAKVAVYNMEGKEVDSIELNDSIFGVEINEHLVHMAVMRAFFAPGTAPLISSKLFSASTLTTSRF